jgi:hypothetical protein
MARSYLVFGDIEGKLEVLSNARGAPGKAAIVCPSSLKNTGGRLP